MGLREGGSYVADPTTGEERLVERTEPVDAPKPATPEPKPAAKPSRRQDAALAEQE